MKQVLRRIDQPAHLFWRENRRQPSGPLGVLWIRQFVPQRAFLQNLEVEESEGRHARCHRAHGEFLLFEQGALITANIVRPEVIESFLGMATELLDRHQVGADRGLCIVAAYEFLSHPLGEYGHRDLLSL